MRKKKIFIIDDDITFLNSLEVVLLKDFDVVKASTGKTFYGVLSKEKPDLILLDVNLPGKNGFEILKELKANGKFSHLPVIMITGDVTVHIDKAFSAGADDCIFKSINIEDLMSCIQRLIK
ncbi:MAG: response regulator [Endomicrobium sp.]|jgi:putative two-component system response regulator|nr:response regulator [Endomicrobium sp.]